jgi:hypothetical protein
MTRGMNRINQSVTKITDFSIRPLCSSSSAHHYFRMNEPITIVARGLYKKGASFILARFRGEDGDCSEEDDG